jgi:MarR family 2-MHQ and catechol resistance regulon transcriptional repressor
VRDTGDRRQVRVELTEDGKLLIEALFPRHAMDIATAMGALEPQELRQLGDLLRKLGMAASETPLATAP